jgi:hypothetical protein
MSTRTNRPTGTSDAGSASDLGDDDPTVIELAADDIVTPVEVPLCVECGCAVMTDDFDRPSLASFPNDDYCVTGKARNWWWCRRERKLVQIWP